MQMRRRAVEVMDAVLRGGVMPPFSAVSTLFALTTDPSRCCPFPHTQVLHCAITLLHLSQEVTHL